MENLKVGLKADIALLVKLQEMDRYFDGLRAKALALPVEEEVLKKTLADERAQLDASKKLSMTLQMKRKEKEIELENSEDGIKKHSMELNAIKSNDAYKALIIEIDNCKKAKSLLENEILDLMESIEKEVSLFKEGEEVFKKKDAEANITILRIHEELKKIESEMAIKVNERNEFSEQISKNILQQYDYIRESRDGLALVPIEGERCGGCSMILRPQVLNDVIKFKDIILCDTCSRILYKKCE